MDCLSSFLRLLAETDSRATPKLEMSTWIALVAFAAIQVEWVVQMFGRAVAI